MVFLPSGLVCLAEAWFAESLSGFQSFFGMLGGIWSLVILVPGLGFRGCQLLDVRESLKLLSSSHLCGGDQEFLLEVFGTNFSLAVPEEKSFPADFVVVQMGTHGLNGAREGPQLYLLSSADRFDTP